MSRYIDADAFKKYLKETFKEVKDQFQTEEMRLLAQTITNDFCRDIDEQQTVDAVPVVICKKCKYNLTPSGEGAVCDYDGYVHKQEWFCADGERRLE